MATIADLVVRISASTDGLQRGLAGLQRSMGAVERQASTLGNTVGGLLTFAALGSVINRATDAADAQEAAQRRLSASSKLLGVDLSGLQAQAQDTAGRFHLSARVAQDFTGSMARLTTAAGQSNRIGEATAAWLNLAAANGISAEESMDALRLTILGQDEGLNKLGLANPSGIYQQWAHAAGIAAGKMTDAQKSQAILDAVIAAGSRTREAYADWLRSAAGQQSVLRAKVEDSAASIGQAFNGIKVVALPMFATLVGGFAKAIGGIELFGADLFVGQATVRVWAAQVSNSVANAVQGVLSHFTGLASFLDALPAPIKAMMGLGGNLRLGTAGSALGAGSARELAAAQAALRIAREARDEVSDQIVRDVAGFANAGPGGGGLDVLTPPPGATGATKQLRDAVDSLVDKYKQLAKAAGDAWKQATNSVNASGIQLGALPRDLANGLKPISQGVQEKVARIAKEAPDVAGGERAGFLRTLAQGAQQLLQQFSPLGLAFQALDAVIRPLQPLIDALLVPFTAIGTVISSLLLPVLRLLWGPLKILGVVVSYIGEVIAKVAGAIATAIGSLVRGIGRLVNKLPGSPGDPLVKAGQAMVDLGNQFKDAAKDMAAKRKELEGLSFDDALNHTADAANRLSEALINAAEGFKIERFRFAAADAGSAAGAIPRTPPAPRTGASTTVSFAGATINIPIPETVTDPVEAARLVIDGLKRLALSHPEMLPVTGLLPG